MAAGFKPPSRGENGGTLQLLASQEEEILCKHPSRRFTVSLLKLPLVLPSTLSSDFNSSGSAETILKDLTDNGFLALSTLLSNSPFSSSSSLYTYHIHFVFNLFLFFAHFIIALCWKRICRVILSDAHFLNKLNLCRFSLFTKRVLMPAKMKKKKGNINLVQR